MVSYAAHNMMLKAKRVDSDDGMVRITVCRGRKIRNGRTIRMGICIRSEEVKTRVSEATRMSAFAVSGLILSEVYS